MGSSPTTPATQELIISVGLKQQTIKSQSQKQTVISKYKIPQLQQIIALAWQDMHSTDPIGKRRYFVQVVNFIFQYLQKSMNEGRTLFQSQQLISQDLITALQDYPIGQPQAFKCSIAQIKPQKMPNLCANIKLLTKQTFTDRIKQLAIKSKEISYEFNKQMQIILQKYGGYKFKGSYKSTGVKAYMRILTKIMDQFLDPKMGSRQVYTNMNHYFWTPIFIYFNKLIDQNVDKIQIQLYDWIRCKVSFKTISQLQAAYTRLSAIHGKQIFRLKNRISLHTRDVLINLTYKGQYCEIQLALSYDSTFYDFNHKLYQLTREKLGVAYCCFTQLLNETPQEPASGQGVMTQSGYIKKMLLREKVQTGFERIDRNMVQKQWPHIQTLLDKWEQVALKTGLVKGNGFKERITDELYGPHIAQMLIIKKRSNDKAINWLNWMDQ